MVKSRQLRPQSLFDGDAVEEAFAHAGISVKHALKVANAIAHYASSHPLIDFPPIDPTLTEAAQKKAWLDALEAQQRPFVPREQIKHLPKEAYALLERDFVYTTSKIVDVTDAPDRSTTKLLIELQDGQRIESVIMRYGQVDVSSFPEAERKMKEEEEEDRKYKSNKRATLCVSSQIGCAMKCTFCATGTMGLLGNLTVGEILEQLVFAHQMERIRNVVWMGLGEPLDNYDAMIRTIRSMTSPNEFGLAPSRVSVSTVGVTPRIWDLCQDAPHISFALSLHAPTQALREKIVPTAKHWYLHDIMDACEEFIAQQNQSILQALHEEGQPVEEGFVLTQRHHNKLRHLLLEYILISPLNTTAEVAHKLGQMLTKRSALFAASLLLNLIPYNPTIAGVPHGYQTPAYEETKAFAEIVRSYGIKVMVRQTMGADAGSACGQLVIEKQSTKKMAKPTGDIEDFGRPSTCVEQEKTKKEEPHHVKEEPSSTKRQQAENQLLLMQCLLLFLSLTLTWRVASRLLFHPPPIHPYDRPVFYFGRNM